MAVGRVLSVAALLAGAGAAASAVRAQAAGGAAVQSCASIEKRSARLACYDDAARAQGAAPPVGGGSSRARATAPVASAPQATQAQTFGAEQVKTLHRDEIKTILVRAVSATDLGTGHWRIAVEGGAMWEVVRTNPYWDPPRRGQLVRIRRGAMGGYLMDVGREGTVQVARIR